MDSQMNEKQVERNGETEHLVNGNGKAKRGVQRASKDTVDLANTGGISPPELMTLKQVAEYLGISVDYARRTWVKWTDHGVNPIRLNGKAKGALRFKKTEIIALVERWRVQQD